MNNELRSTYTNPQQSNVAKAFSGMRAFWMVFFFLCSTVTFAQKVQAVADSTSIKIGEEIKLSLEVEVDTTAKVVFPEGNNIFLPLELLEAYDTDTVRQDAKYRLIKEYGVTQFDSGTYYIPKQIVLINDKPFFTDSIQVAVADVPVDTIKQPLFHIKKITAVDKGSGTWWIYLLIVFRIDCHLWCLLLLFCISAEREESKKEKSGNSSL